MKERERKKSKKATKMSKKNDDKKRSKKDPLEKEYDENLGKQNCFHMIVTHPEPEIVDFLLKQKVDFDLQDQYLRTPFNLLSTKFNILSTIQSSLFSTLLTNKC